MAQALMRGKLMLKDVIEKLALDIILGPVNPLKENVMKAKGKKKISIKEKQDRKKEKVKTKVKDASALEE